ncbi:3-dehydroquinate dehydratase [Mesotoga sp. Brook.08.YT.4.2.5.1]|uniref:ABC transporter ATP-binding protein n=2 Tax=Mesotoga TaxID=1184396 RepID=UPI000C182497|nr:MULTISPECIES: ABC transporter ATP-binding protein [unclassified Mesotoga]RAM59152.1 3-dehydroquinate dehydratase [Mesotoga sp. SC_4PWL113PWK15]PNE17954.1 3-dehydroquinate dehydratase [Mesotoga sp. Brook.08.YT.4.2.5.1]PNS42636.1 3-dehydroquinate dehydratase [Mesotoga sp. B105.6.4]PVD17961.1 ABC transporter [Mesotoga sp. Brook.08.105.5.1]RAO97270.1 ABC transporter [Mesotoga sp. Brook.08.YT.4.2.5.4.]
MIEIRNLTKIYSGSVKAVDDVSLTVKEGEIFGFLGPNGAGKTTTIKMIVGLLQPTSGSIHIDEIDVLTSPVEAKMKMGYVADEPLVMEKITGVQYLNMISDVFLVPPKTRAERALKLLQNFKLSDAVKDPVSTYSHGMRQKLSLVAALIHNPDLWILDEPIVGLDPESAFILKQMMRNHVKAGNTVFFSTHVMEVAEKICDRIGIINKGKLEFVGTVDQLRKLSGRGSLEELFLEVTGSETENGDFSYLDAD